MKSCIIYSAWNLRIYGFLKIKMYKFWMGQSSLQPSFFLSYRNLKIWLWDLVKQATFFFLTHKGKRIHFPLSHYPTSSSALTYTRISVLTAEKMEKMCLWAIAKLDVSNVFSIIYIYLSSALLQIWFKGKEKLLCMEVGLKVHLKLYFWYFIS